MYALCHLTFLRVHCPGHARLNGTEWADRLAGKATLTSGLLLRRSEVLRSLRCYLWAQSQGHTTDRLEERGMESGSARPSSLTGQEQAIVNQKSSGTVSKGCWVHFWEMGWHVYYGLFQVHRSPSWTELNWNDIHCTFTVKLLKLTEDPLSLTTHTLSRPQLHDLVHVDFRVASANVWLKTILTEIVV